MGSNRLDAGCAVSHPDDSFVTQVGAALGLAAGAYFLNKPLVPLQLVGATAAGSAAGVLMHAATAPRLQNAGPNRMLHEIKT